MSTYIFLGEISKNTLSKIRKEDLFKTVKLLLGIIETDEHGIMYIETNDDTKEIVENAVNLVN